MTAHPTGKGPLLNRFLRDERGAALILVTVMLPVLVGFSLLAIDMSRVNNLHNDLQKAADAFALAAAAELDGRGDADVRAERALTNLVQNSSKFSDLGGHTLVHADIVADYLTRLPSDDRAANWDALADAYVTTDPVEMQFVRVRVTPTGFSSIFPASFLGGADNFNVGSSAVAGFAGVVTCDLTPVFICNPFPGESLSEIVNNRDFFGSGINMVPGESWSPGNFGFLRPAAEHGYGENELAWDIARSDFRECTTTKGLHTQTGNITQKVKNAFNTRFDMGYGNGANDPHDDDATVAPAPNVRRGYKFSPQGSNPGTDPCDMQPGDPALFAGLPRDSAQTGLIGDGNWDFDNYVAKNQLGTALSGFLDEDGGAYSNANPPSRYDLYMYEIGLGAAAIDQPSLGGETGAPACHDSVGAPERRLIFAALVDCTDPDILSNLNGQSGAPIPAMGYASFFLTEPVVNDVYAEIVDIDGIEGRGTMANFARDNVQLYR